MKGLRIRKDFDSLWRQAPEELPILKENDSAACLVLVNNNFQINYWNQHYQCWDDNEGDDYEMNKETKLKWILLEQYENREG